MPLTSRMLHSGDTVDGNIVSVSPTQVLVDIATSPIRWWIAHEMERLDRDFLRPWSSATMSAVCRPAGGPRWQRRHLAIHGPAGSGLAQAEELLNSQECSRGCHRLNRGGVIVKSVACAASCPRRDLPAMAGTAGWRGRSRAILGPAGRAEVAT